MRLMYATRNVYHNSNNNKKDKRSEYRSLCVDGKHKEKYRK